MSNGTEIPKTTTTLTITLVGAAIVGVLKQMLIAVLLVPALIALVRAFTA